MRASETLERPFQTGNTGNADRDGRQRLGRALVLTDKMRSAQEGWTLWCEVLLGVWKIRGDEITRDQCGLRPRDVSTWLAPRGKRGDGPPVLSGPAATTA